MMQIKLIAFGLIFGIAGFLIGSGILIEQDNKQNEITPDQSSVKRETSIMIDTGEDLLGFSDVSVQESDTVYSVLERAAKNNDALLIDVIDYGDIGMFINSINGFASGDDNKYWQYWVNNEYGTVSADKHTLEEGDVILWKFTASRFTGY